MGRIEKKSGSGTVLPDDIVCLRAHTGNHLDIEGEVVRARWDDCGDLQTLRIEREETAGIFSGDFVFMRAHTGKHVDVGGDGGVRARWEDRGDWQRLQIENWGGRF